MLQLLPATAQPSMLALPIRMKSWSSSLQSSRAMPMASGWDALYAEHADDFDMVS